MLFQVLFLELITFGHALLQDNGRPFSLCRLIKAKHVSFAHKVRQLIIISLLVSSLLKQLSMLLYSSWYAEGMQCSTAWYVTPSIILCCLKTTTLLLPALSKVKLTRLVIKESLWLLPGISQLSLIIYTWSHTAPSSAVEIEPRRICIVDKVLGYLKLVQLKWVEDLRLVHVAGVLQQTSGLGHGRPNSFSFQEIILGQLFLPRFHHLVDIHIVLKPYFPLLIIQRDLILTIY